jgi:hypothetical protein
MMKYNTELFFTAEGCGVGDKFQLGHMEEIFGVSPQGHVRLVVSPPLFVGVSCNSTERNKQVLRRAQVSQSIFERQPRTGVEKVISPLYTAEPDRSNGDSGPRRGSNSGRGEIRRRPG